MIRCIRFALPLIFVAALLMCGCQKDPAAQKPVDANGDPILVDIAGQFQITLPYFKMSVERVPVIFQGQFTSPEGQREYLHRLTVESVFYLEGQRRKYFRKKEYEHTLNLRYYAGVLEEFRKDLEKSITIPEEKMKAEWERTTPERIREKRPYEKYRMSLERGLKIKAVDEAYEAKKQELLKEWQVKINYDLLKRLDPETTPPEQLPKLDDKLAEGTEYSYTVGQLLKRIDEAPDEAKEKIKNNKDPKKMLDFVVGEDVLFTYAVRKGFDKTATYNLRKKIYEVATLSMVTRREIIAEDIQATETEAKEYYDKHPERFKHGEELVAWEQAKDVATRYATEQKRLDAMEKLAESLMRHRFPTTIYEANIAEYLK